jgi:type II secretory pathway component GspD/PulD (secretin)
MGVFLLTHTPRTGWSQERQGTQVVYCNINKVDYKGLINGVRIMVSSDGVLDFRLDRRSRQGFGSSVTIRFPQARLQVPHFHDVGIFPVSTIQFSVPQDAQGGIGAEMTIQFSEPSRFEVKQSTDQQSVIIMVYAKQSVERGAGAQAGPSGGRREGEMAVTFEDGLLTIRALKADIHQLMGEIARVTGVNIAVDDGVRNRVSMTLENMTVDEVIQGIASGYGLALDQREGVYMITGGVPTNLSTYNLSGTESFPMEYVGARTAASLLPTFLFKYALQNEEQNAVVVTAPRQMLDKIREDLRKIDIASPQIMVEALAVEFTHTEGLDLGFDLFRSTSEHDLRINTSLGTLTYRDVGPLPHDFQLKIQALAEQGLAKIHANPRMAVTNGGRAEIFIGTTRFILVRFWQYGSQQESIRGVDVGVTLEVSPWTGGNGEITTRITPKVSNIVEIDPQTGLPLLSTRQADTSVRVKDGETIAIGGLTLQQEFDTKRKIPLLGDLPGIGELFTSRSRTKEKSELVIFVTPHILTDLGRLQDEEAEKRIREKFLGSEQKPSGGSPEWAAPEEEGASPATEAAPQEAAP